MRRKPPSGEMGSRLVAAAGDALGADAWARKDHGNLEAVGGDTGMGHAVEDGPVRFTFRTGLEWGVVGAWSQSCCSLESAHLKELEGWAGGRREGEAEDSTAAWRLFLQESGWEMTRAWTRAGAAVGGWGGGVAWRSRTWA